MNSKFSGQQKQVCNNLDFPFSSDDQKTSEKKSKIQKKPSEIISPTSKRGTNRHKSCIGDLIFSPNTGFGPSVISDDSYQESLNFSEDIQTKSKISEEKSKKYIPDSEYFENREKQKNEEKDLVKNLENETKKLKEEVKNAMKKVGELENKIEMFNTTIETYENYLGENQIHIKALIDENKDLNIINIKNQKLIQQYGEAIDNLSRMIEQQKSQSEKIKNEFFEHQLNLKNDIERKFILKSNEDKEIKNQMFNLETSLKNEMEKLMTATKMNLNLFEIERKNFFEYELFKEENNNNFKMKNKRVKDVSKNDSKGSQNSNILIFLVLLCLTLYIFKGTFN